MNPLTQPLAEFAACFPAERVPASVTEVTQRRCAIWTGLAVMGCRHPLVDRLVGATSALGGGDQVPLLGRDEGLSLPDAPLVLAAAMISAGHELGLVGECPLIDAPVAAAALAACRHAGADGSALIAALAVASEVATRVDQALRTHLTGSGWAPCVVSARVGSAVAAGRLLGLDEQQMISALGIAATQSGGFADIIDMPVGRISAAKAAGDGAEAAALAALDLQGPALPLEGRRGLAAVLGVSAMDDVLDGLGRQWRILDGNDLEGLRPKLTAPQTVSAAGELNTAPNLDRLTAASRADAAG